MVDIGGNTGKFLRGDGTWQTPTDTNNAVTQTIIDATEDTSYRILLSGTADNTTRTEGAKKNTGLTFNPKKQTLSVSTIETNSISTNGIRSVQLANDDFIYKGSNAKGYMSTGILSTPLRFGLYHGTYAITAASTDITNAGETGTVLDVNGTVSGQKVVNLYQEYNLNKDCQDNSMQYHMDILRQQQQHLYTLFSFVHLH